MSLTSAFLWRFLDDVWDLLPTEDRDLMESYWRGLLRIGGNLQKKTMEANMSLMVENVPVFLSERWNRFAMNDSTADLFPQADVLTLTGTDPTVMSRETVFYHTLSVSNATGSISYVENVQFYDETVRTLRYGKLVANTVAVKLATIEYVRNRDYAVDETLGTVQRLPNSRMPEDVVVQVYYNHDEYTEGVDYEVNQSTHAISRVAGSIIGSGDQVTASYQYNGSATTPLAGTSGSALADLSTFEDLNADFSGVTSGRTLTIPEGLNAGAYTITAVLSSTQFQVGGTFAAVQTGGELDYSINAFPHGMTIDKAIVSIPTLQNSIENPSIVLVEDVDYTVSGGVLSSRTAFPLLDIGPTEKRDLYLWAEETKIDRQTPYRNFGVLIDFFRENSEEYKLALQGLWYAFWTGSTHQNLKRGLHILLGLPYAKKAGTVISASATSILIEDTRGQILTYTVPTGLVSSVSRGSVVERFEQLTNGVTVIDRGNDPGFVTSRLGRPGINRFLTDNASIGPGSTDETKALELLEHHLFLPQVLAEAVTYAVNVAEMVQFLDNMKPQWTEYVFSFNADVDESLELTDDDELDVDWSIDLTATIFSNEENTEWRSDSFLVFSNQGRVPPGAAMATGNFQDPSQNFATLGIGKGDYVGIRQGAHKGYHEILARIDSITLSLDIADADLVIPQYGLLYIVLQKELVLGHDAIGLKREHVILDGTEYLVPAVLNTKTDADLGNLDDVDIEAMLLIDITNTNNEIQAITAADVATNELTVAVAPSVAVQAHEIASASILVQDTGMAVTDAAAI